MSQPLRVAVVLSGCGVYDGAEIYESVLTLLRLDQRNASVTIFAPDKPQLQVVNHLTGEEVADETRNALIEAARIARGAVEPLAAMNADNFDALVVPGGFGAAKNLCDFAVSGKEMVIDSEFLRAAHAFRDAAKPIGLMCIAPVMAVQIFGDGVRCTLGVDCEASQAIEQMGAEHCATSVEAVCVDEQHKLVTTSAYMQAGRISEAAVGIHALVDQVLEMAG